MNITPLDKWDFAVIDYVKQNDKPKVDGIYNIWAERNAVDISIVHANKIHIAQHFLNIIDQLELCSTFDIVNGAFNKEEFWKIKCYLPPLEEIDFNDSILAKVCSIFTCAEVYKLPGYREHIINKSRNGRRDSSEDLEGIKLTLT